MASTEAQGHAAVPTNTFTKACQQNRLLGRNHNMCFTPRKKLV